MVSNAHLEKPIRLWDSLSPSDLFVLYFNNSSQFFPLFSLLMVFIFHTCWVETLHSLSISLSLSLAPHSLSSTVRKPQGLLFASPLIQLQQFCNWVFTLLCLCPLHDFVLTWFLSPLHAWLRNWKWALFFFFFSWLIIIWIFLMFLTALTW